MPSGETFQPKVINNRDGTITVRYSPSEAGVHLLTVMYNGSSLDGSPLEFSVVPSRSGSVRAFGPGLRSGMCGTPCCFTIATADADTSTIYFPKSRFYLFQLTNP